MSERTHYKVIIKCGNCGNRFERHIKLGVTVAKYVKKEKVTCGICECVDANLSGDGQWERK